MMSYNIPVASSHIPMMSSVNKVAEVKMEEHIYYHHIRMRDEDHTIRDRQIVETIADNDMGRSVIVETDRS